MSKKEEKQAAIAILQESLKRMGLDKSPAASNVLGEVEKPSVTADLTEGIANLVGFALQKQKDAMRKAIDKLPE